MTKDEALKLALEFIENSECGTADLEARIKKALAQPEQEPVALLLTDKNINSLQVDSIQRLIDRLKHAHHTDIHVRINGHDEWFEADWLKHMVRVTPSQPEQNPMSDEMLQAITDPENQPSQYGTVTLDYHFEKIKKWEDLFERMSNKVLQQLEQEPVACIGTNGELMWLTKPRVIYSKPQPLYTTPPQRTEQKMVMWPCLIDTVDFFKGTVTVVMQCEDYKVSAGTHWLSTTPPQRKPLTDEEIKHAWYEACKTDVELTAQLVVCFARAIEAAHGIKE